MPKPKSPDPCVRFTASLPTSQAEYLEERAEAMARERGGSPNVSRELQEILAREIQRERKRRR